MTDTLVKMLTNHLLDVLITIQIAVQAWMLREIVALKVRVAGLPCHPDADTGKCDQDKKKRGRRIAFLLILFFSIIIAALLSGCATHTFTDFNQSTIKTGLGPHNQQELNLLTNSLTASDYGDGRTLWSIRVAGAIPGKQYNLNHSANAAGPYSLFLIFPATNSSQSIPMLVEFALSNTAPCDNWKIGDWYPVLGGPTNSPAGGTNDPPGP